MRKKSVYKPKSNVYRKILQITQSALYTPRNEEWFLEKFSEFDSEKIKEALLFLCHTSYLCRTYDGCYAVDYDFRLKIKGVYHTDGNGGHIHPDSGKRMLRTIYVPENWNMGAKHNDIVEVAVEGELSDFDTLKDGRVTGTVSGIIEPGGEYFVGTQHKINGKWVVLPKDHEIGEYIPIEGRMLSYKSGILVFAKLNLLEKSNNLHEKEYTRGYIKRTCTIIKLLKDEEEAFLYKFGLYPEISEQAQKEFLTTRKRLGKPFDRLDLSDTPSTFLTEQCAVNIEKCGEIYRIMMHVSDLSDWFMINSASEAELLRKAAHNILLPDCLKDKVKFSDGKVQNALTVSFETDKNGNVYNPEILRTRVLTQKKVDMVYKEASKVLPKSGISSNPVICASNDAAALWFDKNNIAAPFMHVVFSEHSNELFAVAEKLGWCDSCEKTLENVHKILSAAKKQGKYNDGVNLVRGLFETVTEAFAEEFMTVDFCSPFENYLSILAQHCFAESKHIRTNEQKTKLLKFVSERSVLYNYRRKHLKYYSIACANLDISKKLESDIKCKGVYVCHIDKDKALIFVNGNFGTMKTTKKYTAGDEIDVLYVDLSLDCMELLYKTEV